MATASFIPYRIAQLRPPCAGPIDELFATVFGKLQDDELALLRVAALSRLPATCPDDGLDELGQAYDLARYPGESNDAYRARLLAAWPTWDEAGSPQAVEDQVGGYMGGADVHVYRDEEGHWFQGENYARFIVVLGPNFGAFAFEPLTAPFTAPATGGSTATIDQVRAIKRIVLRWKAAHGYPVFIILRFADVVLGNINSTAPFTPPVDGDACVWDIGKLIVDNIGTAPFVAGYYEV